MVPVPTTASRRAHVGGSRLVDYATAAWVPIPEHAVFVAPFDGAYTLRCETRTTDAGTTVAIRIWDITANSAVATGGAHSNTAWTEQTIVCSLTSGHRYRVEMVGSNGNAGILAGPATLEV